MPKPVQPSLALAGGLFLSILLLIGTGLFVLEASLHALMLVALLLAATAAWSLQKAGFAPIRRAMYRGIEKALPAIAIFILIGVLVAALIQAGTVASLIVYGLHWIHPAVFLPAGLLLCSLMSLATGTSWGTVGTAGIVLMGIGDAMGIPAPLVAGMVVSGACFGDKMSPVSDTTNLAAMSAGTELYRHIRSMLCATGPAYLLALVLFSILGGQFAQQPLPEATLIELEQGLASVFSIHPVTLLPLLVMFGLILARISAEPAMLLAAFSAVLLAVTVQDFSLVSVLNALHAGGQADTGIATLDSLLSRGGITSMMWTLSLALLALALGGILQGFGFLQVLLDGLLARLQKAASLVATTIAAGLVGNMALGEAYMSIILNCQLFQKRYDEEGIDRAVLSRSVEEGATLTTVLIPWTTGGAFFAATLGVPVLDYAPWALLNWINPLLSIVMASAGLALWRTANPRQNSCELSNKVSGEDKIAEK